MIPVTYVPAIAIELRRAGKLPAISQEASRK